jgi:hypothetical protein
MNQLDLLNLDIFCPSKISDIKNFTLVNLRPDLEITQRKTIHTFSHFEEENLTNWQYDNFDYEITELGFRGNDLPNSIEFGAFGCSFTFGQGLPYKNTWSNLLANLLNCNYYNFGQPAIGITNIAEIFILMSNFVQMKKAIFLLPPYNRLSVAATNKKTNDINLLPIIASSTSKLEKLYDIDSRTIYKHMPDIELIRRFKDYLYLIKFVSEVKKIDCYFSSWDHETYTLLESLDLDKMLLPEWASGGELLFDYARDQLHPGPIHHFTWVNKIKEYIK